MLTSLLYLVPLMSGLYVIWHLGRGEYYDEEKLIDLVLLSTVAALVAARVSFFLFPFGREEWFQITGSENLWLGLVRVFQLNTGAVWWMGLIFYFVTGAYLLWRWKWPYWPMLGILGLGLSVAVGLKELLLWYWMGFSYWGLVLVGSLVVGAVMVYLLKFGGNEKLGKSIGSLRSRIRNRAGV